MKFLDLFSGIGGFRLGMEMAGHECIGYVEIDKFARRSYKAIFDTSDEWTKTDIREVTDDEWKVLRGTVDVICGGFPCQPFSITGNRRGFSDTRGTMFFEIARAACQIQPKVLFLENVKHLLTHDNGKTFEVIIKTLDELGYDAEWQVCNSSNYGVPQNRERLFLVGHLRGSCGSKIFPLTKYSKDIDTGRACASTLIARYPRNQREGTYIVEERKQVNPDIVQRARGKNSGGIHDIAPTLTSNNERNNYIVAGVEMRTLTPRECWRLQGFPDWTFDRACQVNSDTQLYKQAGNSVTVPVIYEIAKRLI